MKYERILQYVNATPWAILPSKMTELLSVLAYRSAGHSFSPEEIRARIGASSGAAPAATRGGGVAVLPIRGVIAHRMGSMDESSGGTSTERLTTMLRQVVADASISTIVLDVDSPGGTVPGVQELADEIFVARSKKRIVAVSNSLMASAAYWIASQAHEIVSIPSGTVGSIGVFTVHEDLSAALEKEGIKVTLISAGKYKVAGNPFEPLSEEEQAVIRSRVDAAYDRFAADVARGRGVSVNAVKNGFGQGRALIATEARSVGLIDGIATLDAVIATSVGGRRAVTSGAQAASARLPESAEERFRRRLLATTPEEQAADAATEAVERDYRLRLL